MSSVENKFLLKASLNIFMSLLLLFVNLVKSIDFAPLLVCEMMFTTQAAFEDNADMYSSDRRVAWIIFLKHMDVFDISLHKKLSEMKTRNLVTFGCVGLKMSTREPSRKIE